jgi:hypothetical protein
MKHLGWKALRSTAKIVAGHLLHGQTNFLKMLWKFNSVYNPELQLADHRRAVKYEMVLPPPSQQRVGQGLLYIHQANGRQARHIDDSTEQFVETTRMGTSK